MSYLKKLAEMTGSTVKYGIIYTLIILLVAIATVTGVLVATIGFLADEAGHLIDWLANKALNFS